MDKNKRFIIQAYLGKSEEKLRVARELLKIKQYDDAISRAYYSAFHAAQAVLLSKGLSAQTHRGLLNLFGLHFIKTGKLSKNLGKLLAELKDDRERCDYEVYSIAGRQEAEQSINEARKFLKEIKRYLAKAV